jgi:hypothetical protein
VTKSTKANLAAALCRAADDGNLAAVRSLLAEGASVNVETDGETPLAEAAHGGHLEIVRALLDAGADINAVDLHGMTPRDLARAGEHADVEAFLRERGGISKWDQLRAVARTYSKRYSGKSKFDENVMEGLPPCLYAVKGSFHGRPLKFLIFDGGCIVEGETERFAGGALSVNGKAVGATIEVPRAIPGSPLEVHRAKDVPETEARAAFGTARATKALSDLTFAADELAAVLPQSYLGYSKEPTFFYVYRGADLATLDARLRILEDLFPYSEKRAAARDDSAFSKTAYQIKIAGKPSADDDRAPHRFGGELEHELTCRNCKTPMHLLLTLDTQADELELPPVGRRDFRVVYCLNCMSFPGLLVLDYSKLALRVLEQAKQDRVNEDDAYPPRRVTVKRLESPTRHVSKVGGTPTWIQGPDIPDCVRCKQPMSFFVQLRSLPDLSFVDEGTLYTFVCAKCKVSASLIQSH